MKTPCVQRPPLPDPRPPAGAGGDPPRRRRRPRGGLGGTAAAAAKPGRAPRGRAGAVARDPRRRVWRRRTLRTLRCLVALAVLAAALAAIWFWALAPLDGSSSSRAGPEPGARLAKLDELDLSGITPGSAR